MSKRQKSLLQAALICILLAAIIMAYMTTLNAEKAPETQYWQLLNGDDAWLITPPECNLQVTEYGGSYYFVCVDDKQ